MTMDCGTLRMDDPAEGLKAAMRHYAAGVTVVTTGAGAERRGVTATAFTSVTMDPPTILVCINREGGTNAMMRAAGRFCVNVLAEGQEAACMTFAGQGGLRGAEQFSPFEWRPCHGAGLALQGALASIACVVSSQVEMGTHTIFFGTVEEVLLTPSARPLLHYDRALRSVAV
ncbi:flavin reductase family protein [Paenirhodobacter sp.]|jgi:flavin reductase (DIM6/NTAB) family NADH-FMN oxidoreductase RutF|uniref:flavin reductase family protein n=1 Tax=Paenirhodobacter sp. TaxID=1965326 RepID=UPI003B5050F8